LALPSHRSQDDALGDGLLPHNPRIAAECGEGCGLGLYGDANRSGAIAGKLTSSVTLAQYQRSNL